MDPSLSELDTSTTTGLRRPGLMVTHSGDAASWALWLAWRARHAINSLSARS